MNDEEIHAEMREVAEAMGPSEVEAFEEWLADEADDEEGGR